MFVPNRRLVSIAISIASTLAGSAASAQATATATPSFSCIFTEPFVIVDSFPGGVRYKTPEGEQIANDAGLDGTADEPIIAGKLKDGSAFELAIRKEAAGDGMSDFTRPYSATLTGAKASGGAIKGACLKFPDGTTPRPVVNVAVNDTLNVRERPSASSTVVGTIAPRGIAWAFPENSVNGFVRAAAEKRPQGEAGEVTVIEGWVKGTFLGRLGEN